MFGGPTADWRASDEYLGDHEGLVAYGPAPDQGQCDGSPEDFSSANYMTSPSITDPVRT